MLRKMKEINTIRDKFNEGNVMVLHWQGNEMAQTSHLVAIVANALRRENKLLICHGSHQA